MRSKTLLILAAAVVVLLGFIVFFERHQPSSDERAERADRVFAGLQEDRIVSVALRTNHGPVRLQKTGDDWRLAEPVDYPADAAAVRSLIQSVAALDHDRVLPFAEVDPGDYGLAEPSLGVTLVDDEGTDFTLAVGSETPLGSKRAVRRDEDDEILLVAGAFVSRLDTRVDGWRSRDVVDVLETELASVRIETTADVIEANRVNGVWQLSLPVADLADAEQMRSLVSELNALRISEFLPEGTPDSFLDPALVEYRVELRRSGDEAPVILELGAATESETGIICRRNGEESFRIPDGIRARLGKAPVLWRSAKVWPFSSFDVGTVEISNASASVALDSVDHVWTLADGVEAEQAEVRRRLIALTDLEAREHDLVHPPTEVMGTVIVVLDDDGGAEGLTYTFYAPIEEGGHAAVKLSSRANVMGVDAAVVETIVGDLERLRPVEAELDADPTEG